MIGLSVYIIIAILFGGALYLLTSANYEFDKMSEDDVTKAELEGIDKKMIIIAVILLSSIWVITIPVMIIINIFERGGNSDE